MEEEQTSLKPAEMPATTIKNAERQKVPKGMIISITVLSIVALVGIGFGIYSMISGNKKIGELEARVAECSANDNKTTQTACPDGTPVSVVDADMANEYQEVVKIMKSIVSGTNMRDYIKNSNNLAYKMVDIGTFVPLKLSLAIETSRYDSHADVEADLVTIKTNLANAGFGSIGIIPFRGSAGREIDGYLNPDADITCGIINNISYDGDTSKDYILLECANTSWTWLTKEDEALVKALITAYHNATNSYPSIIWNWENKIENSKYEPYQHIWVSFGGGVASFYRTSPDAEWQYFNNAPGEMKCSNYNTEDLKKAYFGERCWDNGQSTVQL